ncbi:MAG: NADH-quinone oxidoreductase subunit H [Promethearchaeota archaeon]
MTLDLLFIIRVLVFPGFTFIFLLAMFFAWVDRKLEARMQNRIGPNQAGPGGILQPFADFIKLLIKEDVVPIETRSVLFKFVPIFAFSLYVFTLFLLPIDGGNVVLNSSFQGDLILILSLVSIANLLLFLSGWASTNPYSAISAKRVLMQFLGYDLPLFVLALAPAFIAGSLSFSVIVASQSIPFAILIPWVFVLFLFTMQAELEKDPFDIPHADTEIVGGYETEYGGRKLAFLKLAREVQRLVVAVIVVELFLGGPFGPVFFGLAPFWYTLWFVIKVLIVVIISEYLSCIFARLRIDQMLTLSWKILVPLSILSLIITIGLIFGTNFFAG